MRYSILGIMFMLYSLTMVIRRLICSAGVVKEVIDEFHFHSETGVTSGVTLIIIIT